MGGGRLPERGEDAELRPAAIDEKKCTPRRKTGALQPRSLGLRDAVFVGTVERGVPLSFGTSGLKAPGRDAAPTTPPVPGPGAHLELLHEVLPHGDAGAGVAQDDLEVPVQRQARPHVGQPLVGHGRQRRAGHPQQHHEPVAAGALLRGVDEVLRDLQRLHRRVALHLRQAAHGHHGGRVVLHENKGPDHRAVQAGEPATNRETRP